MHLTSPPAAPGADPGASRRRALMDGSLFTEAYVYAIMHTVWIRVPCELCAAERARRARSCTLPLPCAPSATACRCLERDENAWHAGHLDAK